MGDRYDVLQTVIRTRLCVRYKCNEAGFLAPPRWNFHPLVFVDVLPCWDTDYFRITIRFTSLYDPAWSE